jgi:hypothetical protein
MSEQRAPATPIVRFLGEDAGLGGPFALLGLGHAVQSDAEIQRARLRRLRQVDCHPQRATPDAEEVRLAIHSAATQLLDPALRAELVVRWPEGTPVDLPKAWSTGRAMQRVTPALLRRARLILGSSGGWNSNARRRLAHLARVNRLSAIEIVKQLGSNTRSRSSVADGPRALPNLPAPPPAGGWFIAYLLVGALACLTAVTLVVVPADPPLELAQPVSPALESYADRNEPGGAEETARRDRLTHYTAIAHELDRIVARATLDPTGATGRFREIYSQFTQEWVTFPKPALERAGINIAEFVVRIDEQGLPPEQISPLLAVAGTDPDRTMLSVGAIDVTINSAGLRQETMDQLRAIRSQLTDAPMTTGTSLPDSVQVVAAHLAGVSTTDENDWWSRWHKGVERIASPESPAHTSAMLLAMSNRLRSADPAGQAWRETSSLLVRSLGWREGSPERFWLIEQFSDSAVLTGRLAILTEVLVTESSAEGVDQLMVLDRNANDPKRQQIRMRIQDSWFPARAQGSSGQVYAGSMTPLMNHLRVQINATPDVINDDQAIDSMLRLSRLVTAADLRLDGFPELSEEIMLGFDEPLPVADTLQSSLAQTEADTTWAEKAVNSTEPGQLRPYLDELIGKSTIGISSAYALIHLANRADAEMRDLALEQITRFGDQVTVLIAVDHTIQDRPSSKIEAIVRAALQVDLPSRNDPEWHAHARRELLARLGEAMADEQARRISRLQDELTELHALRFELLLKEAPGERLPGELLRYLTGLVSVDINQQLASTSTREQVRVAETLLALDRARAQTPLHRYLSEQRFLLAIQQLRLISRYPETERVILAIEREQAERHDRATSVLQQITQTQRAIAEFVLIELEREHAP